MKFCWTEYAWEECLYWQANDKSLLKRINIILQDMQRSPFHGIGKPEPLRFELAGKWSRRINEEHRIIYEVKESMIIIYQCRYHYSK